LLTLLSEVIFLDKLDKNKIKIDFEDISKISYKALVDSIVKDPDIPRFEPDNICKIDPRNYERIVYSEVRAKRPHDNKPLEIKIEGKGCVVCEGKTTAIIDTHPLSEGYTFINKNLFPILYPKNYSPGVSYRETDLGGIKTEGETATGMHFVQWSSNYHDKDISSMPLSDVEIVLTRLSIFEGKLLHSGDSGMPSTKNYDREEHFGYTGIIKNYGRLVGGSLVHGHQQIVHTNIMPRKIKDDLNFKDKYGLKFSEFMLKENPHQFTLKEMDTVKIMVPYFMKRPLDTMIIFKNTCRNYLHELSKEEIRDLALSLKTVLGAVPALMTKTGREPAYNVIFHNGPSVGLYLEVFPYTQEIGGYEHLGIYLCQGSPKSTVEMYRPYFSEL